MTERYSWVEREYLDEEGKNYRGFGFKMDLGAGRTVVVEDVTVNRALAEEAVALFLQGKIKFLQIADLVEKALAEVKNKRDYTVEDIFETDKAARKLVRESIF